MKNKYIIGRINDNNNNNNIVTMVIILIAIHGKVKIKLMK